MHYLFALELREIGFLTLIENSMIEMSHLSRLYIGPWTALNLNKEASPNESSNER